MKNSLFSNLIYLYSYFILCLSRMSWTSHCLDAVAIFNNLRGKILSENLNTKGITDSNPANYVLQIDQVSISGTFRDDNIQVRPLALHLFSLYYLMTLLMNKLRFYTMVKLLIKPK